jgi:hypothetical protein
LSLVCTANFFLLFRGSGELQRFIRSTPESINGDWESYSKSIAPLFMVARRKNTAIRNCTASKACREAR